jgi:hypothetical protein
MRRRRSATEAPKSSIRPEPKHDEEDEAEDRHRVDAVRQRAAIAAALFPAEQHGLPRVIHVADQHGDGGAGQDVIAHQRRLEAQDEAAQRVDEQELDEVVQRQAEEAVQVGAHEPAHDPAFYRSGAARPSNRPWPARRSPEGEPSRGPRAR